MDASIVKRISCQVHTVTYKLGDAKSKIVILIFRKSFPLQQKLQNPRSGGWCEELNVVVVKEIFFISAKISEIINKVDTTGADLE